MLIEIMAAYAVANFVGAQHTHAEAQIPSSLKAEHRDLHERLAMVIRSGGAVKKAAHRVEKLLAPHFEKEETFAMPPLGQLAAAAHGEPVADPDQIIAQSDRLRRDYKNMISDHHAVVAALAVLEKAGKAERKPGAIAFAKALALHAKNEEEVLYPAAMLLGDYLKLKRGKP